MRVIMRIALLHEEVVSRDILERMLWDVGQELQAVGCSVELEPAPDVMA